MNLQPTGQRIFVKPEHKTETIGGIIIPDVARKTPDTGIVLAFGNKVQSEEIKVGSKLLYRQHSEEELDVDGEKIYMIYETDVLGVLE